MTDARPTPAQPLKIGTRGSPLALAQAHETRDRIAAHFDLPPEAFEVVVISVAGDRIQDKALREVGARASLPRRSRWRCPPERSTSPCIR